MIRCVAFDFDGTLVDSNAIKRQTFFDIVCDVDPRGEVVAMVLDDLRPGDRYAITREIARLLCDRGALDPALGAASWGERLADAYTQRCEEAVSKCPEIRGAVASLEWLAARGTACYVNSATPEPPLQVVVQRRALDHHFRGVFGGPGDKVYNLARARAEVGATPEELLMVGDGEDDRSAATETGCHFVAIAPPGSDRFAEIPTHLLEDLSGLPRWIEQCEEART